MKILLLSLLLFPPVLCLAGNIEESIPLKPNTSILFNDTGMVGAELENGHKVLSNDSGEFEFWVSDYTDKGEEKKPDNYIVEFKFSNTDGKILTGFKSFNNEDLKHTTFTSFGKTYFEFEQNIILDPLSGEYENNDKKPWILTTNIFTLKNTAKIKNLDSIDVDELKSFIQNNLAFKSEESNEMYGLTLELGNFMGINKNKNGDSSDWMFCLSDLGIVGGAAAACYSCYQTAGIAAPACTACVVGATAVPGALAGLASCNSLFPPLIDDRNTREPGDDIGSPIYGGGVTIYPITRKETICSTTGGVTTCWTRVVIVGYWRFP